MTPDTQDATEVAPVIAHIDHFQRRVLQDALASAEGTYWRRRAETFDWARPRPADYRGRATSDDLRALDTRCRIRAEACRQRAAVALANEWEEVA